MLTATPNWPTAKGGAWGAEFNKVGLSNEQAQFEKEDVEKVEDER